VLLADGVPSPGSGRTYQLWFVGPGGARPAGTFGPGDDADVARPLTGPMADAAAVAVTIEPSGGVEQPTGPRVLTFPMPTTA